MSGQAYYHASLISNLMPGHVKQERGRKRAEATASARIYTDYSFTVR